MNAAAVFIIDLYDELGANVPQPDLKTIAAEIHAVT